MVLHVQQLIVMLQEVVSTTKLLAKLLDAQTTNAILHPTNVKSLFQTVMMVMLALTTLSIHLLAAFTLHIVLLLMYAQSPLAKQDAAQTLQRTVTIAIHAQLTLAIFALELVLTLLSLALAVLEILEHAILKLLFAKLENLVSTTATVLGITIQLTFHSVIL
jgi:hypothetical protein